LGVTVDGRLIEEVEVDGGGVVDVVVVVVDGVNEDDELPPFILCSFACFQS